MSLPVARLARSAVAVAALVLLGCTSFNRKEATSRPSAAASQRPVLAAAEVSDRGSAELWSQSCGRCHYVRDPAYYTPGQWRLVMMHMRVRGYLTGAEHREIGSFLRDSSR